MFEKEAEDWVIDRVCKDCSRYKKCKSKECCTCKECSKEKWQYGVEFGYNKAFVEADKNLKAVAADFNKANEWHYPSKGEHPKEYEDILIYFLTEDGMKDWARGWYENDKHIFKYLNALGTQYLKTVIAWKEIVLPELKE